MGAEIHIIHDGFEYCYRCGRVHRGGIHEETPALLKDLFHVVREAKGEPGFVDYFVVTRFRYLVENISSVRRGHLRNSISREEIVELVAYSVGFAYREADVEDRESAVEAAFLLAAKRASSRVAE